MPELAPVITTTYNESTVYNVNWWIRHKLVGLSQTMIVSPLFLYFFSLFSICKTVPFQLDFFGHFWFCARCRVFERANKQQSLHKQTAVLSTPSFLLRLTNGISVGDFNIENGKNTLQPRTLCYFVKIFDFTRFIGLINETQAGLCNNAASQHDSYKQMKIPTEHNSYKQFDI